MAFRKSHVFENMDALAERVADGELISAAGAALGLSRRQTEHAWANIRRDLGWQAV